MVKEEQNTKEIIKEDGREVEGNVQIIFSPLSQEKRNSEIQATRDLFMTPNWPLKKSTELWT